MRERGTSPAAINNHIRGVNRFLGWLAEQGHCEPFRLPRLKPEKRTMRPTTEAELKAIGTFRPKKVSERRLQAICLTLLDTGMRIIEALSLERAGVDFDDMLLTVRGKGNKRRVVPFSVDLRQGAVAAVAESTLPLRLLHARRRNSATTAWRATWRG